MRLYNKSQEVQTVRFAGDDYKFNPGGPVHQTDYELGCGIIARNPNIVDYDVWLAQIDAAPTKEEKAALVAPVAPAFELPGVDEPQSRWLEKAVGLGLKGVGRYTSKVNLIKLVRAAIGAPPGPPVAPEVIVEDKQRLADVLSGSPEGEALRAAGRKAGIEIE